MIQEIQDFFKEVSYIVTPEEFQAALNFFSVEREHIRNKVDMLSWDASDDDQQHAIDYLSKHMLPTEYIYLIFAGSYGIENLSGNPSCVKYCIDKSKWGNAAETIIKIGWPNIEPIIIPIFYLLLDLNWPGSLSIYNYLLTLPQDVLYTQMKKIVDNPQWFKQMDYQDLKWQIDDLCYDSGIDFETLFTKDGGRFA